MGTASQRNALLRIKSNKFPPNFRTKNNTLMINASKCPFNRNEKRMILTSGRGELFSIASCRGRVLNQKLDYFKEALDVIMLYAI